MPCQFFKSLCKKWEKKGKRGGKRTQSGKGTIGGGRKARLVGGGA